VSVESTAVWSAEAESTGTVVESTTVESKVFVSVCSEDPPQAAADKEIISARKPNLNAFFIGFCLGKRNVYRLIPQFLKGNHS
jgi:hypothetical protein